MKVDKKRNPDDVSPGASTTRNPRGSYTPVALIENSPDADDGHSRPRKTKCDGARPTCGSCASSGHECTWGAETAKKPSTKQYVESLKKRANALQQYASYLESKLDQCQREHGGLGDDEAEGSGDREPWSYLRHRPTDATIQDELDLEYDMVPKPESDSDGDIVIPMGGLVLEDGDPVYYGTTSIFRHSPNPSRASRFPEILEKTEERYVLMVEGGDESHFNPNFDWARHLPTTVPLDRREHDRILDLLFKFFTSWCLRIVPALFLRDMCRALTAPASQPPPRTTHYSPMLHNALIAVATAFSEDPRIRDLRSRQYYAQAAKSYIEAECQNPNICVVHALSILASFHSSQGDQTLGYMYFGMSARISQALGLDIDCSALVNSGMISHDDKLDRNWAYWTTFSQDVCWSLYVGRDFCLPASSIRQKIPVPFVEEDFDGILWSHPPSNPVPQPGYLSKTFKESTKLLLIARSIMDVVYVPIKPILEHFVLNSAISNGISSSEDRRRVNYDLVSKIDVELNTWKDELPPEIDNNLASRPTATPHKIMLHLAYWWLFILLHRPLYRRPRPSHSSNAAIDHVKLCNRAADNIMELLGKWQTLYGLRYAPITLVQVVFSAGTVFLLSAVQATSGLRVAPVSLKHSLERADMCMRYLGECGRSWQCANNIAEILRNLLRKQLEPRLQLRGLSAASVNEGSLPRDQDSSGAGPIAIKRRRSSKQAALVAASNRREARSRKRNNDRSTSSHSPSQHRSPSSSQSHSQSLSQSPAHHRSSFVLPPSSSQPLESPQSAHLSPLDMRGSPTTMQTISRSHSESQDSISSHVMDTFRSFEYPYPAPVGPWPSSQQQQPISPEFAASSYVPGPGIDEDDPMSRSMEAAGFLGMLGGNPLPEGPHVPYGILDPGMDDQLFSPQIAQQEMEPMPQDFSEADLEAIQQWFGYSHSSS
ncbi:hypothetical protein HGRIS_012089 [Hohenbuehelia grisea]|uniref:Xylanolytic transcriptional activator regulatory domain-containing protein n=1 Tax=Hohenbuehelia grisea TaxID=104357 RepID=A0ABR3IR90_9AGAR